MHRRCPEIIFQQNIFGILGVSQMLSAAPEVGFLFVFASIACNNGG